MASSTIRVRGLREVERAFRDMDRALSKELKDSLKEDAGPVAEDSREKISRYPGASLGTIKPRVGRGVSVFVTQRAKKKTGKRGDFGSLQLRRMIEALDENEPKVIAGIERTLDRLAAREGF